MQRHLAWIFASLVLLGTACDEGATAPAAPPFIPPPPSGDSSNTDPEDAGGTTPVEDAVVTVPLDPSVTLVGIKGLVGVDDGLFCASNVEVIVDAPSISWDDYALRLQVRAEGLSDDRVIDGVEPTADPDVPHRYIFELDASTLLLPPGAVPTDGLDPEDPANTQLIQAGANFTLIAVAMKVKFTGELTMPSKEEFISERIYTFDATPPTLNVWTPDPTYLPPTLTGQAEVAGLVDDNLGVGRVEVSFDGELLATLEPGAEETTSQQFASKVDLRFIQTSFAALEIRAFDRCGLSDPATSQWSAQAKVVSWPFLKSAETRELQDNPQINMTRMADWDGDDFLDMIVATQKGIWVVHNKNPNDAEDPDRFRHLSQLTTESTDALHVLDLEQDGDADVVAVSRLASGSRGLVVYRTHEDGSVAITEEHTLPINDATEVRTILVADFTNDPEDAIREDIALATDAQEDSLLLFKRHVPDVPQEFDDDACEEVAGPPPGADVGAPVVVEGGDGASDTVVVLPEGVPDYHYVCPTLFSDPIKSGGVANTVSLVAADVTGDEGEPDGVNDILVGTDDSNQIRVFANRFLQVEKLDTAFAEAVVSYIYPGSTTLDHSGHFCLGNFIDIPGQDGLDDPVDLVAAPGYETWRVLRGMGNGFFRNYRPPEDAETDPYEI